MEGDKGGDTTECSEEEVLEGVKLEADCSMECGEGEARKVSAVLHEMLGIAADWAENPTYVESEDPGPWPGSEAP